MAIPVVRAEVEVSFVGERLQPTVEHFMIASMFDQ
jgi:hypothetical protein